MNIGLLDCDITGYPNIALMKISSYYKKKGYKVQFITPNSIYKQDKIFASKVFLYGKHELYEKIKDDKRLIQGGTGFDIYSKLPEQYEHIMPDYDLYNAKASQGFITRGCIRKCDFCIVPKKEGYIQKYADIDEFYDKRFKDIIFMDNNILAHEHGLEMIKKAGSYGLSVNYNQGLDFRLLTDDICKILKNTKKPYYTFAFDNIKYKKNFIEKMTLLSKYDKTSTMVYILSKNTEIRDCFERIIILKKLNKQNGTHCWPSIQVFRNLETGELSSSRFLFAIKPWASCPMRFFSCSFLDDLKKNNPDMIKMYNKYNLSEFENA